MDPVAPWTADRVAERLVMAFRLMPFHAVYTTSGGRVAMTDLPWFTEVLAWPARYVADQRARVVLMTWARCRAMDESVRDRYRCLGWARTPAERRRRDALDAIAAGLNTSLISGLTEGPNQLEPNH